MQCFIISSQKATALRTATAGRKEVIEPRRIDAGPYAGQYAVPARCFSDRAFERIKDRFDGLTIADIDIAEAWPPQAE